MASDVTICNRALSKLGANLITSFNDGTLEANLCKINYPSIRNKVLEEGDWSFATENMELPQDSVSPPPDSLNFGQFSNFIYQYRKPKNALRVISVNGQKKTWKMENGFIRTNDTICYMKAVFEIIDNSMFSPGFETALVYLLATEFAVPITRKSSLEDSLRIKYQKERDDALILDGQQGTAEKIELTSAVKVR